MNKILIQNGVPTLTIVFTSIESGSNDPDSIDHDILLYF
jgi:hypothetical protein